MEMCTPSDPLKNTSGEREQHKLWYVMSMLAVELVEVFMWLHIEQPAATNATLPPARIA